MIKYSIEVWIYNPIIREMLLLKVKNEDLSIFKRLFLMETKRKDIRISDEHVDFMWTKVKTVPDILYWQSNQETFQMVVEKLS